MSELKRFKPALTNTQTPWPNLDVKLLGASMVESDNGDWVYYADINKIKAEGVREALKALDNRQKYSERFLNGRQYLEEYANHLDKGE